MAAGALAGGSWTGRTRLVVQSTLWSAVRSEQYWRSVEHTSQPHTFDRTVSGQRIPFRRRDQPVRRGAVRPEWAVLLCAWTLRGRSLPDQSLARRFLAF